jgi:exopolysaccharide biosynthesis WecB/TagA/CpsF family protein
MPSVWYETFGRVIVEAFATGTPVIVSRLGAMAELVHEGRNGFLFEPGDVADLARKLCRFLETPQLWSSFRVQARQAYEDRFTPEANYRMLMGIYEQALIERGTTSVPAESRSPQNHEPTVRWPKKLDLFGVQVSATDYNQAVDSIIHAAKTGIPAVVSFHAVHAIVTASGDPSLRERVNQFQLVGPDGQPVRWALNWLYGARLSDRVYGPELTRRLCGRAAQEGIPVYLYGGSPQVVQKLREKLIEQFPGLSVVGAESPPYRALTPEEDREVVDRINSSRAGLVFIGLGAPKQDIFGYDHRDSIRSVKVCVGAAFDFLAGHKKMAPTWMQRTGLEWLYRLCQEPGRLWHRYLVTNTIFTGKLVRALVAQRLGRS